KCIPCRVGTRQMYDLLSRIINGQGQSEDLDLLRDISELCQETSLCGLGRAAPNPIISTLRYFEDEYQALIPDLSGAVAD
ncbi:MAG: NADH-ubiquinone oxidoreductase-F iron-sulfur binding region domain-containing protein, partial [Chloroflexota bacterium]